MKINSVKNNSTNQTNNNKKALGFTGTPLQILKTLEKAEICPGKTRFLESIALAFDKIESGFRATKGAPSKLVYKLGQINEVPEFFKGRRAIKRWKEIDNALNQEAFKCKPDSTCGCGKGKTKGEFAKELLQKINVEDPEVITITPKTETRANFFSFFKK